MSQSIQTLVASYIDIPVENDAARTTAYGFIVEELAFSFEADGKTDAEIEGMDLHALADQLIDRAER